MKPDICIYHHPCADGFAAAWAIWKRWGDAVEYVPARYGEAPPDVTGKHVLIVDFSYKAPVIAQMIETAKTVTILDHHKSAHEELAHYIAATPPRPVSPQWLAQHAREKGLPASARVQVQFDQQSSGAHLAWRWAWPAYPVPRLITFVEDRDLWRFAHDESRPVHAYMMSHDFDFETWNERAEIINHGGVGFDAILMAGEAIERARRKAIEEALDLTQRFMVIGGHRVPVANLPKSMASDAGNMLAEGSAFAAIYFDRDDGRREFSLRSRPEGLDVQAIAVSFGGGGHARAAGFTAANGWEGEAA